MGDAPGAFEPSSPAQARPRHWPRRAARVSAAIAPWMIAVAIAAGTMSEELAPAAPDPVLSEPKAPTSPTPPARGHSESDELYFDPMELISV